MKGIWKHYEGDLYEVLRQVTGFDGKDYVLYRLYNDNNYRVATPISFVAHDVGTNEEVLANRFRNSYDLLHTGVLVDKDVSYRYFVQDKDNFLSKVNKDGVEIDMFVKVK